MPRQPLFCCSCSVCGRPLEIRDEYAGHQIACPHCGGRFLARRKAGRAVACAEGKISLLERADRLLTLSAKRLVRATAPAPAS